mmetsp:Transcript_5169/g.10876  ORF Transcript_5169/g.10876 Transcript_5169/m.10876 type:complete len:83 (+) Transcript_5169:262-510(+)
MCVIDPKVQLKKKKKAGVASDWGKQQKGLWAVLRTGIAGYSAKNKRIRVGGIHKKSASWNSNPTVFLVFECPHIALIKNGFF